MIIDKNVTRQVLGAIIQYPQYLGQSDKYKLSVNDFSSNFEKILFNAVENLYKQGLKQIQIIDIENYFNTNPLSKKVFENNNGIEYLQNLEEYTNKENFEYYYTKLKKINLLNDYSKLGIKINEFYESDLTKDNAYDINKRFEELTIQEINDNIRKKIFNIENKYASNDITEIQSAGENLDELIQSFKNKEDLGLPIQGKFLNEVMSGARLGTLCIRSGSSGLSKTRQAVGDACLLAYPLRYNNNKCEWEKIGNCEKVLFIATEQNFDEIKKMILAYLTDINESKFRYGEFTEREERIIKQAQKIMEIYKDNFSIIRMPNPTISLIQLSIRENVLLKNIRYVFYDYIFISPSLLNEFKGHNLRNDELLLMMANALKNLAVELNVFIMTSTQVNAAADDNKNIRNEASLAGGRSTINKADYGFIMARPTNEELKTLESLSSQFGVPNIVTDVYKVRGGQWTQVRIWSYVNLGTLKKQDLFITDSRLYPVQDFIINFNYDIMLNEEDDYKTNELLERMNNEL